MITFANHDDFISFRHHNFKKVDGGKDIELKEVGPRFQLRWEAFLVAKLFCNLLIA